MLTNTSRWIGLSFVPLRDQRHDAREHGEHGEPDAEPDGQVPGTEPRVSASSRRRPSGGGRHPACRGAAALRIGQRRRRVRLNCADALSRSRRGRGRGCGRRARRAACGRSSARRRARRRKWRCEMTNSEQSVSHTAVAVRGPWSSSDSSPTMAPGPERGDLAAVALDADVAVEDDERLPPGLALVDQQAAGRHRDLVARSGDALELLARARRRTAARCAGDRRMPSCWPWAVTVRRPG